VPEAISDTGPILHLHEIGRLEALAPVAPLIFPNRVWKELRQRGLERSSLEGAGLDLTVVDVEGSGWERFLSNPEPGLQPADAQVFLLAEESRFEALVLTDDLVLRRRLEAHGATVVGSVGILIRAHASGRLLRNEFERSMESLLEESSLHLSRAFRAYVRKLLADLVQ